MSSYSGRVVTAKKTGESPFPEELAATVVVGDPLPNRRALTLSPSHLDTLADSPHRSFQRRSVDGGSPVKSLKATKPYPQKQAT